jgi:hypothetical protein
MILVFPFVFIAQFAAAFDCEQEGVALPPSHAPNDTCDTQICDCVLCYRVFDNGTRSAGVCVRFNHLGDYGVNASWQCSASSVVVYNSCYASVPALVAVLLGLIAFCACCYIIAARRRKRRVLAEESMWNVQ